MGKKKAIRKKKFLPKRRRRSKQWVLRMPVVMPDTVLVPMRYRESVLFTNISGLGTYVYSMNNIFDPNITGTGHQPLGHDQWATFFSKYEVLASRIKIKILPPDLNIVRFTVFPSETVTPLGNSTASSEQPYSKTTSITDSVVSKSNFITNYMSVRKLEGRSTASINFTAPFGSAPTSQRYWQLMLASLSGTSIADIFVDVDILYYCRLFKRITLSSS